MCRHTFCIWGTSTPKQKRLFRQYTTERFVVLEDGFYSVPSEAEHIEKHQNCYKVVVHVFLLLRYSNKKQQNTQSVHLLLCAHICHLVNLFSLLKLIIFSPSLLCFPCAYAIITCVETVRVRRRHSLVQF